MADSQARQARIARTEAYAESVRKMFNETVNEIIDLKKTLPKADDGIMYSFDGDTERVRKKVEDLLRRLHSSSYTAIKNGIEVEWEKANQECDELIKQSFGSGLLKSDLFRSWTSHNQAAMTAFINRSDNGMNLSDRVWQSCRQLRDEMEIAITVGVGSGESAASMSRTIRHCLNDPDLMFRRFRYKESEEIIYDDKTGEEIGRKPVYGRKWKKKVIDQNTGKTKWIDYDRDSYIPKGAGNSSRGVYKSAYKNAMRVARTETNMAYRRADYERWNQLQFVKGIHIETSNRHPEPDICDEMEGDYPKDFYFCGWHPHCYSDDTMVLTNEGWKLFKDVRGDEQILSLNPDTRDVEWSGITDVQCWRNDGNMRWFKNSNLDCLVTEEHRMVYLGKNKGDIRYTLAKDYRKGKGAFYRGCIYSETDRKTITIGTKEFDFDWFCEFMGYYLSDGSTIRDYQITIAQKDGEKSKDIVKRCLEKGRYRVTSRECCLDFYDKNLCAYLKRFGKYHDKYVPMEIMNSSKRQIRIFLDAYSICDGSRRESKEFIGNRGSKFKSDKEEITYFTTSPKMAGNLSELILKVGGRPSFSIQEPSSSTKKDGTLINGNYQCYRINELHATTATVFRDETVEYHGNVYDLTLEKNHIMYVARNGKCFWGSNCFCYATPILVSVEEMEKVTDAFLEGKKYIPQGEDITDTPESFKQWINKNKTRIQSAKAVPYWMKDNQRYVNIKDGSPVYLPVDKNKRYNTLMNDAELLAPTKILDISLIQKRMDDIAINHKEWFSKGYKGINAVSLNKGYMSTDNNGGININFATDSKGFNAGISIVSAFNKIEKYGAKAKLDENEEYALEAMWHEVLHNKSKNKTILPPVDDLMRGFERVSLETCHQLYARQTYSSFCKEIGYTPRHNEWVRMNGYGYNCTVHNLQVLLNQAGIDETEFCKKIENLLMGDYNKFNTSVEKIIKSMYKGKEDIIYAYDRMERSDFLNIIEYLKIHH